MTPYFWSDMWGVPGNECDLKAHKCTDTQARDGTNRNLDEGGKGNT